MRLAYLLVFAGVVWGFVSQSNPVLPPTPGVKTDTGWKVLIVDRQALRMISSCCKMFDLMDSGITVVEDLYKVKQPMIDQEAVYLMAPTEENIVFLKRDFEKKQRKSPPNPTPASTGAAELTSRDLACADTSHSELCLRRQWAC